MNSTSIYEYLDPQQVTKGATLKSSFSQGSRSATCRDLFRSGDTFFMRPDLTLEGIRVARRTFSTGPRDLEAPKQRSSRARRNPRHRTRRPGGATWRCASCDWVGCLDRVRIRFRSDQLVHWSTVEIGALLRCIEGQHLCRFCRVQAFWSGHSDSTCFIGPNRSLGQRASAPNDAGDDQRHGVGVAEDETHVLQIQIQIPSVGR